MTLVYVDANGDFWRVGLGEDTLFFGGVFFLQLTGYASPDCSGPPLFIGESFGNTLPVIAHAVFLDGTSGTLRVRNTNAKLTNMQIQSILDSGSLPRRCTTEPPVSVPVLAVEDTTVVTPPSIAVSLPLHPVFTP